MKNIVMCLGILTIIMVLSIAPAMAVEPKGKTACTDASCFNGQYRFVGYDWSRYPGSTEICSRWIPPHWVPMQMTLPGGWVYRRVWMPTRQVTRYRWQEGFWQTTGTNMRPDVFQWNSQQRTGLPSQTDLSSQGGYFNMYGMWIPQK